MHESFKEKVLAVVANIPKGYVLTYKEVATKAGNPKASRAVGTIMAKNRNPLIPCHRVVRSDLKMGGYAWGITQKVKILQKEGYIKLFS